MIDFFDTINSSKVHKVYPHKAFCDEKNNNCKTHDTDNFYFFDGYHPSIKGTMMINNLIIKKINSLEQN